MKKQLVLSLLLIIMLVGPARNHILASELSEWQIVINIPEYKLYLYQRGNLLEKYPVAVGKPSEPSPIGDFYIVNKVVNPVWYPQGRKPVPPGPANPLGKYWLGLNAKGYGIHGNNSPNSIGHPVSKGCFRMKNQDIEKLYRLIPRGTPVKVKYTTVQGWVDAQHRAWLEFFPDIYRKGGSEQAVAEVLMELGWSYQPHYQALGELITRPGSSVVEVPRVIEAVGELTIADAFLWNNDVYFDHRNFNLNEALLQGSGDQNFFAGYIGARVLDGVSGGKYKCDLDLELNRVNIHRLKVFVNDEEIDDLGRFVQNVLWIDGAKIGQIMAKDFWWNQDLSEVLIGGQRFTCITMEGRVWLSVNDLKKIKSESTFEWDEKNRILKLFF